MNDKDCQLTDVVLMFSGAPLGAKTRIYNRAQNIFLTSNTATFGRLC